jgi:AcrR family transcriptional regulator
MSQNSSDLRVRRTHKLLREALLALIEERGFDAITVGEIAERAMVSRAAFYRYYRDKYDLVEQIFEETVRSAVSAFDPLRTDALRTFAGGATPLSWDKFFEQSQQSESAIEPWAGFFEQVGKDERLYRMLLGGRGSAWFGNKVRTYLAEVLRERLRTLQINGKRLEDSRLVAEGFVPTVLASLLVDILIWWLERGRSYTPRQAATYCSRLTLSILKETAGWE